jgi:hypothetical protein
MMPNFHLERSRHDIRHFYEWLSEEYRWAEHIEEWMEMYNDRAGAEVHRVCIIAPRSHSKSCTLRVKLLHMCLFSKWKGKHMTVWLFSASKPQAMNRLEEIRDDMRRHPELRRLIDERRSNKQKLQFTNGSWIKATSVGSSIRGEHPAVVALDDVLAEIGDLTMETVNEWFKKVVTPMCDPGSYLFVVGTPMALTDLYHTQMLSKETWKSGVWSAFSNWDEYQADPDNTVLKPLWPDLRPTSFLMEQKLTLEDDLAFAQEYLCKVVDDDAQVFKRCAVRKNVDMDCTISGSSEGDDSRYVIGFDPSHGIGKDFTVMIALRQDAQGIIHFVDMWRRNDFPPDKQADMIIEWCGRYNGPTLAAEDVGFQRLYESILQQKGAVIDFHPSKASNKGLKQGLLNRLRTWFERDKFQWPYGNIRTRDKVNVIWNELDNHVWKGGDIIDVGKHNDTVMALAHAIDRFNRYDENPIPIITGKTSMQSWKGNEKPKNPQKNAGSRYISLF